MSADDIDVEVHVGLIRCAYRMPDGTLFKRKYIGYSRQSALACFKREVKEQHQV